MDRTAYWVRLTLWLKIYWDIELWKIWDIKIAVTSSIYDLHILDLVFFLGAYKIMFNKKLIRYSEANLLVKSTMDYYSQAQQQQANTQQVNS